MSVFCGAQGSQGFLSPPPQLLEPRRFSHPSCTLHLTTTHQLWRLLEGGAFPKTILQLTSAHQARIVWSHNCPLEISLQVHERQHKLFGFLPLPHEANPTSFLCYCTWKKTIALVEYQMKCFICIWDPCAGKLLLLLFFLYAPYTGLNLHNANAPMT